MKFRRSRFLFAPLIWAACIAPCQAGILWYNGDYDGRDALSSATNLDYSNKGVTTAYSSFVYDDFVVPAGQTWTITSVFGNFEFYFNNGSYGPTLLPTTATWQIRTGVSTGIGGTVVASGDTTATVTPENSANSEYKVAAAVPSITLQAGTYWLTVAPNDPDTSGALSDYSGVETTSGANAVGTPPGNDGNSYITTGNLPTTNSGYRNFAPTSNDENAIGLTGPYDYSFGVVGTPNVVPEPASLAMLALGLAGVSIRCRRRLFGRSG
jgi:PEP-CTERM motif